MNTRALTATLLMLALAACTSTPTPTGTPTGAPSPTASPAPTATPALTPTPTATPTASTPPTPTPTGSNTGGLVPTPAPTPTPTPSATPTATPTAAPTPEAWPAADRISRGSFTEPTIAVDAAGSVHIAAAGTGTDNQGIWYLTNASGRWAKQQAVTPWTSVDYEEPGRVDEPAIAIDPSDGSVWIAFAFWACADCIPNSTDGIFLVNNTGGTWSQPVLVTGDSATGPSLAVRGGHSYLAYDEAAGYSYGPVSFATDASGAWLTQTIAPKGNAPTLVLNSNGRASILFATRGDLRYARQKADGSFAIEHLPGTSGTGASWVYSVLAVDAVSGDQWAAWTGSSDQIYLAQRGADGWSNPSTAIADGWLIGLGVRDGVIQLTEDKSALVYTSNSSGAFVEQVIDTSSTEGPYSGASALALLPTGRPIVVFTHDADTGGTPGIWFLKGPGV